ncbi:hypothetical protein K525DRAFT_282035 [Schizophyllum commune Loenen D]|nr:hypothetical protein K525DRAFT_282035 [Schizophyllum commune Loenen D]
MTYRYNDRLVYVSPEKDYEVAIDVALQEYPELATVPRELISFHTMANMDGQRRAIRIGRTAWPRAMDKLMRGEVVDIIVRWQDVKGASPPQYLEVPGVSHARSRSPSPTPSERSILRRLFSRAPSPRPEISHLYSYSYT